MPLTLRWTVLFLPNTANVGGTIEAAPVEISWWVILVKLCLAPLVFGLVEACHIDILAEFFGINL
ncbi:hypothetical protein [Rhizobium sp. 18065]|uniref:hypothetical protein n=1 Tax=Rhizobium sp. 18065 TaxID=2681411 RepID=UPI0013598CE0|nr:hypothetical protein [Rhizobium sp. 18065]